MSNSIRVKLFWAMSCLILFFVCLTWFLNSQCLEKYYLMQKKNTLIKYSKIIDEVYKGNPQEIDLELEKAENATGGNIIIVSKKGRLKYNSRDRIFNDKIYRRDIFNGGKQDRMMPPQEFLARNFIFDIDKLLKGEYIFKLHNNPDGLNMGVLLSNGDILVFRTPLEPISESAKIASRFSLFVGILVIILGSIFASAFSKRFTRPILELNEIARSMAKLDFSKKCKILSGDEIGELSKSINVLSDQLDTSISELNEANKKLQEDIEKERKIDKMRKEFISGVSHELKTPIALIQGYAEGLKDDVIEDEENRKFYSEVIADEADKMGKIVKDLLNLSQMESGYFKLERSIFNMSSLIEQILNRYKRILNDKGIQLTVEKDQHLMVDADQVRIEQVLINFINNAIDHLDDRKQLKIRASVIDGKVRISVYNSGKTIPEASMKEIWTSFYKLDKARTRAFGGSGLGLSIVRAIQQQHHNGYGVENLKDGVEFWFECDMAE